MANRRISAETTQPIYGPYNIIYIEEYYTLFWFVFIHLLQSYLTHWDQVLSGTEFGTEFQSFSVAAACLTTSSCRYRGTHGHRTRLTIRQHPELVS